MSREVGRFAPTPSGPAHPGTLLAGLLAWLDARSLGARFLLRMEDVDRTRCTPEAAEEMRQALRWLGLEWDAEHVQSQRREAHEAALDRLAAQGALYPCTCTRSEVRQAGERTADGGWRYPGTCRSRALPEGGWRAASGALRLRLEPGTVEPFEESELDLGQDPLLAMGDPVLLRADGSIAYHLAVVVDDGADEVTRVVRGRDLATSTAIHVTLQRRLALPSPRYRHHALLLEESGGKLAKLHGAVGWHDLQAHYSAPRLCGLLAWLVGLLPTPDDCTPEYLLPGFSWKCVGDRDVVLGWTGSELVRRPDDAEGRRADDVA
jgi:glutamyl/glutaminyl-tRNA synthetase